MTRKVAATLAGAALIGGAVAFLAVEGDRSSPAASQAPVVKGFWPYISPHVSERNPPRTVTEAATRAEAIVLARVTGVVDGREDAVVCQEVAPEGNCPLPRSIFVQLTVDRAIHGAPATGQVINLEMRRPPSPLTIESVLRNLPPGQLLFFLNQVETSNVYVPLSRTRGAIAQNPKGLYLALAADEPGAEGYLASFQATTVDGAATKAQQSRG